MSAYPAKVERVLRAIRQVEYRPWQDVAVEFKPSDHGGLYVITAIRPGGVFTEERLSLYVGLTTPYTIEGTDLRMRGGQRFQGGNLDRFGDHVKITGWPTLYRIR